MPFVHLVNHSHYSMLRSSIRIEALVAAALADAGEQTVFEDHINMKLEKGPDGKLLPEGTPFKGAMALTDHANMFGALDFYFGALKKGIKPILGCELLFCPEGGPDRSGPDVVMLLAENDEGYHNLIDLVSQGYLLPHSGEPVVDWKRIAERNSGLFALYGGRRSNLGAAVLGDRERTAEQRVKSLKAVFGDHLYLMLQNHGGRGAADEEKILRATLGLCERLGVPPVATNDNHYAAPDDQKAWQVLRCIDRKEKFADYREEWPGDLSVRRAEEMELRFRDWPEALANTVRIADACNVIIEMDVGDRYWPRFPIPEGFADADEYLAHLAWERAPKRYPEMTEEVRTRIQYELDTMKQMHVAGYMLIVQDFIVWAKENGVPVGPGRGSAAGSVVAYVIGITNIDPMKYGLLFERFLNPERVSMPDIDTDFADSGRAKVIEYVSEKYGRDCVGQMATYGKLKAKAVLNDVGSALGVDRKEIAVVTKLIPPLAKGLKAPAKKKHEDDVYADEIQEVRDTFVNGTELYRTIWEISLKLEGLARQPGLHAAAVIIAPRPLRELAPLYKDPTSPTPAIQYDKTYAESVGFLKMDFLGLRNLSVITDACEMIRENHGVELDMDNIDIADPETYRLLQEGRTVAVFQFESAGMRNYLRQLKPTSIFELIAMNALYRPGPMDSIPTYISRKNGREPVDCYDPKFEPILGETYGVIVYQEQVMRLAQKLSSFTLGGADQLRRAMSKKKGMEKFEGPFKDGAVKNGFPRELAEKLWDVLIPFSNYAFNKSHSAAYGFVGFQTAFLKAHYPAEYMAANITSEINSNERVAELIQECRDMGIRVIPPDVNKNLAQFSVKDGCLNYGLAGIRNVGLDAGRLIVAEREKNGPFRSVFDFARRMVAARAINKKGMESLAMAGAFDNLPGTRAEQFASVDKAIDHATRYVQERESAQVNLFGGFGADDAVQAQDPQLESAVPWSSLELLAKEKAMLGLFVSSHPLQNYRLELRSFASSNLLPENLNRLPFSDKPENLPWSERGRNDWRHLVYLGGMIEKMQSKISTKGANEGKPFGTGRLADQYGGVEVVFWPDVYARVQDLVGAESIVLVSGYLEHGRGDRSRIQFVGEDAWSLESVMSKMTRSLHVDLDLDAIGPSTLEEIAELLDDCAPERGAPGAKVVFHAAIPRKRRVHSLRDEKHVVEVTRGLVRELGELVGGEDRLRLGRSAS